MSMTAVSKFKSIRDFPELVEYLSDELDWPIETDDFDEMTFEYSAAELGLDEKTAPKFLDIRRLRPLDNDQPWGIFFIRFDDNKLPVVALRRLLSKLVLKKRSTSNAGDRASWHESDLLLISQTGSLGTQSISFAHFAANPEKTDLPILKVLGWDDDDTGLKIDYVIETLREKLVWPDDPTDSDAWRAQWRDAFTLKNREVIQSSKEMAERLGQLALAVRTRLREVLAIESEEGPVHKLMSVFKENLISDLDTDSFSDMYAQTIAYGLLSARIINPKANTADAAHTQIPITNPFLKDLMETFLNVGGRSHSSSVGLDFDELGINEVVDLLDNSNMEAVLRDFGDRNQKEDPVMHFFEGFLQVYDSKIRKDRGVFYTPQPVVSFIVRSVDEQLRMEFGLEDGLADTTTWGELAERIAGLEMPEGTSPDQAFVQILDPATGTGTFPVEVIDLIYKTMVSKWQSQGKRAAQIKELWNDYVPRHLLPRLHGYELMMAPYAIAHMKMGLKLYETGYRFNSNERARIYLTNALEPPKDFSETFALFIPALAFEVKEVSKIKKNKLFTVVIGNPPYFGAAGRGGDWIAGIMRGKDNQSNILTENYFEVEGATIGERNPKWLNDDYVKFVRLAQWLIDKTGVGICGFITNNGYLDNPTFRGMRESLKSSFNDISIIDLHGSSKKEEVSSDGTKDENVFDIMTGVGLAFFVKKLERESQKSIRHADCLGLRNQKYQWLRDASIQSVEWNSTSPISPFYLFVPQEEHTTLEYQKFHRITDIMPLSVLGFQTHRDKFAIDIDENNLKERIFEMKGDNITDYDFSEKYGLRDNRDWQLSAAREKLRDLGNEWEKPLISCLYRPFDEISCYFSTVAMDYPRRELLDHVAWKENLCLLVSRQTSTVGWRHVFASSLVAESCAVSLKTREGNTNIPLYCYDKDLMREGTTKRPNVSPYYYKKFCLLLGLNWTGIDNAKEENSCSANDLFCYIYAILHSNKYRTKYANNLRMDFPRVPFINDKFLFEKLRNFGQKLINIHLMKDFKSKENLSFLIGNGTFQIEKITHVGEIVWIDKAKKCGFQGISDEVWNFHIGGHQVCAKWLKDRGPKKGNPGRILTNDDVAHYQNIIFSISETIRVMAEIDETIDTYGGWPNAFITADT